MSVAGAMALNLLMPQAIAAPTGAHPADS